MQHSQLAGRDDCFVRASENARSNLNVPFKATTSFLQLPPAGGIHPTVVAQAPTVNTVLISSRAPLDSEPTD
jgi:hypothetical protein